MAEALEKGELRLEDFISLAMEGKKVNASVELKKQVVTQKVHPADTEEMKAEIEMYLLLGEYTFNVGGKTHKVSKIYVFGTMEEPLTSSRENKNIANARLKMDYKRLADSKIIFEEKYF